MAPLSILPGRIRFENRSLIGRHDQCCQLEHFLSSWAEVQKASVNPRTGRILIRYDEKSICREQLTERLGNYITPQGGALLPAIPVNVSKQSMGHNQLTHSPKPSKHFVRDMLIHAVLPSPLDLLVPAVAAIKR